jgi:aspartyl/asparaginyl-tRNA synthetase
MNVVDLVKNAEEFLGKEVTVTGKIDRPRKKHSSYLFFNIEGDDSCGVQVVVKRDMLGQNLFNKLVYGLCHGSHATVTGYFDIRNSNRNDFHKYEITVNNIVKTNA